MILGLSRGRLLRVWFRLEINMIFFLMLLSHRYRNKAAGLQYLIVQSIGSVFLLIRFLVSFFVRGIRIFVFALLLKVGAVPCHLWFFAMIRKISWDRFLWLSVIQKILPLYLLRLRGIRIAVARGSILISGIGGITRGSLKQAMGYSSLLTFGWVVGVLERFILVAAYMLVYGFGFKVVREIMGTNEKTVRQGMLIEDITYLWFFLIRVSLWRIAGIPPTLGFYIKIFLLKHIIPLWRVYGVLLLLVSGMILYIYLRVLFVNLIVRKPAPLYRSPRVSSGLILLLLFPLWRVLRIGGILIP